MLVGAGHSTVPAPVPEDDAVRQGNWGCSCGGLDCNFPPERLLNACEGQLRRCKYEFRTLLLTSITLSYSIRLSNFNQFVLAVHNHTSLQGKIKHRKPPHLLLKVGVDNYTKGDNMNMNTGDQSASRAHVENRCEGQRKRRVWSKDHGPESRAWGWACDSDGRLCPHEMCL